MVSSDTGGNFVDTEDASKFPHGTWNKIQILKVDFQGPARDSPPFPFPLHPDIPQNGKAFALAIPFWVEGSASQASFSQMSSAQNLGLPYHPILATSTHNPYSLTQLSLSVNISSWCIA